MQVWCVTRARERVFETGYEFLLFSEYSDPYPISVKIFGLNRTVKTSECCEGTGLCHLNMNGHHHQTENVISNIASVDMVNYDSEKCNKQHYHLSENDISDIACVDMINYDSVKCYKSIKQHPHKMNPLIQEHIRNETDYVLNNSIIQKGKSDHWAPYVLMLNLMTILGL